MPHQRRVAVGHGIERRDRLLGNYQHMQRRLRRNIAKSQTLVVFVNDVGGNFPIDDPLENAFRRHNEALNPAELPFVVAGSNWFKKIPSSNNRIGIWSMI